MPASSKKQFRFMKALSSGNTQKPGITKEQASEYVSANNGNTAYDKLPETKPKFLKLHSAMQGKKNGK